MVAYERLASFQIFRRLIQFDILYVGILAKLVFLFRMDFYVSFSSVFVYIEIYSASVEVLLFQGFFF